MTGQRAHVYYLTAPRSLEIRSEVLPTPGPHDLVCATIVTAISPGTELAAYVGLPPLRPGAGYPRVQGYCNVARVTGVGAAVTAVACGDLVLTHTSHRSHFVLPADAVLVRLPERAVPDDVVCAYLFHLGYNAVIRSDVRPGSRVVVIGLGVLGLTSVALAALAGADVVAVSDHVEPRRVAESYGAKVSSRAEVGALCDGLNADVVISTSNAWADWMLALRAAGNRGTIAVLGFPGRGEVMGTVNPLDSQYFYSKQLRIEAVGVSPERPDARGFARFNERENLRFLTDRIIEGALRPSAIVSGTYPADQLGAAYLSLLAREKSCLTYLLSWP